MQANEQLAYYRLPVAPTVSVPVSMVSCPPVGIIRRVRPILIRVCSVIIGSVIGGVVSVTAPAAAAQEENE